MIKKILMKIRFKIFLVIGVFVGFYFALQPIFLWCLDSGVDYTLWYELINLTRPVIHIDYSFWDDLSGTGGWSGTVQGIESAPPLVDMILMNIPFIFSMVIFPSMIISTIVIWDKRK